ncbi:MAG: hypothetical protein ACKVZ0_10110 [Gemmatimonadales bacterium]
MTLSAITMTFGARIASALLGLDRLFRSESGDPDGLVVVNLDLEGRIDPAPFASYAEARSTFAALGNDAVRLPEPDRRAYYADLCESSLAFIDWRGGGLVFEDQLTRFLHVRAEPASEADLGGLRDTLRTLLEGRGYHGILPEQCAAWEAAHRVDVAEVPRVLESLLDEAWDRTEATLMPIPRPKTDRMRVATVSGVAYNARCNYLERTVELNTDPILTRPGLKHLAVHEGCPGHYLQFTLRRTLHAEGRASDDVLFSVVNTASSSVFEGIADAGMEMIGWQQCDDDRIQAVATRYRSAIATGAAWRLHALRWPAGQVADWLRSVALLGGEGWVANRMAFIAAPARAALIWSYWWGEPAVIAAWRSAPSADRSAFLEFLHGRMHSIRSVGMFPSD